jgi:hypothetical protein
LVTDVDKKFRLIKQLEIRSDRELYKEAIKFLNDFGTLTNSQMSNLENIFKSTWSQKYEINSTIKFINNQRGKAFKQVRDQEAKFWAGLRKKIEELPDKLIGDMNISEDDVKTARYFILKEFIQHLIAEHRFRRQGGK